MSPRPSFRELISRGKPLVMPAAHDALSARIIELAGFDAFAISGSGMLASRHALPDLGLVGLGEMAAGTADILAATRLPCMNDGDDGYGDVKAMVRTVRANERLGVGVLVIEDQSRQTKQPGQNAALAVVPEDEIAAKLRVAIGARDAADFWIFGRTDAYGTLGIEGALRRGELFLKCGVDGLFIAGVRTSEHLERVGRTFAGVPLTVVVYGGEGWPSLSISELHRMGYTQIVYPLALILPMCILLEDILQQLRCAEADGGAMPPVASEQRARDILARAVDMRAWLAL